MTKKITLAIDAMGGDWAPDVVIDGVAKARTLYPQSKYVIYGDENRIKPMIDRYQSLSQDVTVGHTPECVSAEMQPSQALRKCRQSSMGLAIQAVKAGEADVAVSAGNTGALMALSKFTLRTMPGIDRPALISLIPTLRGDSVMLDLGANVECNADNLIQFAIMGSAYARTVLGHSRPTVGLLNIGVEDLKGRDFIKEAAERLKNSDQLHFDFRGFVEGSAIGAGDVDVIVTDGFTGNVALKTVEGTAKLIASLTERAFKSSLMSKLGYVMARSGLKSLKDHLDPNNHNGGVFMGLNGLVVKSHGGANADGIAAAISTAIDMTRYNVIRLINEDIEIISGNGSKDTDKTQAEPSAV